MPKPLTIAGIAFPDVAAANKHCRRILYADRPGTNITGVDAMFVEALLMVRADKLLDLQGMNVLRYYRGWQPGSLEGPRCFVAELEDGTRVDFGFKMAVRLIAHVQQTGDG